MSTESRVFACFLDWQRDEKQLSEQFTKVLLNEEGEYLNKSGKESTKCEFLKQKIVYINCFIFKFQISTSLKKGSLPDYSNDACPSN